MAIATALAHDTGNPGHPAAGLSTADGLSELAVVVPLALSLGLYGLGLVRLWRRAGWGHGIRWPNLACFAAGWLALAIALLSPLHDLGERLFAAHMIQHEILIAVAAPLVVLGRPAGALSWAVPRRWRRRLGSLVLRARPLARAWGLLTRPAAATAVHGVTIWAWHWPALFEAALARPWMHWLEHASMLATGLVFWWALAGRPARALGYGASVACLFVTLLHTSVLGTLLTLSPGLWYAPAPGAAEWGLTALEDQQLAGLIMWIPGGLLYTAAALALAGLWITGSGKRRAANAAVR